MKYVAAFLLAKMTIDTPSAADVKSILASVDAKVDDARLNEFLAEVEGKDVEELLESGSKLMATLGGGGGAAPAAAPAADAGAAAAPAAAAAKEPSEEDEDMGFGLFD